MDSNSSLMDGLGDLVLEYQSLKSSFQNSLDIKTQDIIQTILSLLIQKSELEKSVKKSRPFEDSDWVSLFKSKKLSSSLSDTGQNELDSPNLFFVLKTVLTAEFDLLVDSILNERVSWGIEGFGMVSVWLWHW